MRSRSAKGSAVDFVRRLPSRRQVEYAIRAMAGTVRSANESIARTNTALGIKTALGIGPEPIDDLARNLTIAIASCEPPRSRPVLAKPLDSMEWQDTPVMQSQGAHDRHAGHSVAMFRDRFWITLLLSIPTLVWSGMMQHVVGFSAPAFPGSRTFQRCSAPPSICTAARCSSRADSASCAIGCPG